MTRELTKEGPVSGCCAGKVKLVTTITVDRIDGLALPEGAKGTLDPYIVVRCEGEKVQSVTYKDNRSPVLDFMATFYRKTPANPIIIEVYNKNRMFDDYLSEAKVDWPGSEKGDKKVYNLYGRGKEVDMMKPGNVTVYIRSSDDPQML
ncbi:calpain-5 [Elysia marginata]|uniref:Calpain-5 n=1 Tax=Elysia marginata TaxID=1093978 RepID=A0AAV4FX29_9GAST|nr:calpain-5 [Elysia marginata]